jgi:hypothetical protein
MSKALKLAKLQNKLGADGGEEFGLKGNTPDSRIKSIKVKKNYNRRASQQDGYDPDLDRNTLENDDLGISSQGGADGVGKELGGLELNEGAAERADDSDDENLDDPSSIGNGKRVRTGKLANFFGVRDDNVGTIRRIVDNGKSSDVCIKVSSVLCFYSG